MEKNEVEFEKLPDEKNGSKKWKDMTGMEKFLYVVKVLFGLLLVGGSFAGGWAARGKRDAGLREKARLYDENQAANAAAAEKQQFNRGGVQQPGMRPKPGNSNFMGGNNGINRSVDQLVQ